MAGAGFRSWRPRRQITLTVATVVVAGGAAAVAHWPHAWWWLIIVTAVAATVVPPALAQAAQRWQDIGRVTRAGFKLTTGPGGRELPTVSAARLEARAHRTVVSVPYIRRDEEGAIGAHLRAGRPVLLIGPSMVGKTRMAARVINDEYGDWRAAVPDTKTGLADLDAKGIKLRRCVIWLDDIERLIGEGGITEGALQRLAAAGNVIIGTIRTNEYERFLPSDQSHLPEWDVLSIFEHVSINRELTPGEQERLEQAVTDPTTRDRIRGAGLGEYAGAAWQVIEALKLGAGARSVGYALVLAAADWRRCGMTRPLSGALLPQLAGPRLDQRGRARLNDQAAFSAGLAWATRDINPSVSLLRLVGPDAYDVYDYALDRITEQGAPVPDDSWVLVIANADPYELLRIGYTAEFTYHRVEIALRAWRVAANSGHSDVAPRAAFSLGNLLREQRDADGAMAAYQQAIDSGHPDAAPLAAVNLGVLLADQGDADGAKAAYQQAINSGHPDAAPRAAGVLGLLLQQQGDADGAKAAYQQAINSGHTIAVLAAAAGLGNLLREQGEAVNLAILVLPGEEQGDAEGAKAAYQQAINSGDPDAAPLAAVNLGVLLADQGDVQGAKDAFQEAIDSGHAEHAPRAAANLGVLLADQGDVQGARDAFQQAIDSGHAEHAPRAAADLGLLLLDQGDMQGAKDAYQKVIDSGHADVAPKAALNLGVLLLDQGDEQGAKDAFQKVIDSGHANQAPKAALNLGVLLAGQGDEQAAKDAFQKVIHSGHPEAAPLAAVNLGVLLAGQGDEQGARDAYEKAINSGHAEAAPIAAANLRAILEGHEDTQSSEGPHLGTSSA